MSVGVSVLCHSGECIIMAADTRGRIDDPSFPPNEAIGKQFELPFGFVISVAGGKAVCQSFANQLYAEFDKLKEISPLYHDHIRNAIREAQLEEFRYRVDYEMFQKLGTRLREWHNMSQATFHYRRCQRLLRSYYLPLNLTVGGFMPDGTPLLLTAFCNDPVDMQEFGCIGSGSDAALRVLMARHQNCDMSPVRALVHVDEAMEESRKTDSFVGQPSDYAILTKTTIRRFPKDHPLLRELRKTYAGKDTRPLDDDLKTINEFLSALYYTGVTKEEYDQGIRVPTRSIPQTSEGQQ